MFYSPGKDAKLVVSIGRGRYLSVCQGVDEFGFPAVRYKILSNWNDNKAICDLVQHD